MERPFSDSALPTNAKKSASPGSKYDSTFDSSGLVCALVSVCKLAASVSGNEIQLHSSKGKKVAREGNLAATEA